MDQRNQLRIFRRQDRTAVLGPGIRAVIWVQGCPFGCPGCIVPESWPGDGGETVTISEMTDWLLGLPGIEGLTLSGGEPMQQPEALRDLITRVRASRDIGVMCYTGYRHEDLLHRGSDSQRTLLAQVDLLVDGPYIRHRHAELKWRGSSNQRLIDLNGRYADELAGLDDSPVGLELQLDDEGLSFTGVPPRSGFVEQFRDGLAKRGILLGNGGSEG
ncbi:MAG: radical SAM protein [Planctomycetales bacterium]|nr:radical SAM protein [bacterium]UNM06927.1 MAG: radical SAM protein [Planctomycetales bacterium]